jgi:hypothetical protein
LGDSRRPDFSSQRRIVTAIDEASPLTVKNSLRRSLSVVTKRL